MPRVRMRAVSAVILVAALTASCQVVAQSPSSAALMPQYEKLKAAVEAWTARNGSRLAPKHPGASSNIGAVASAPLSAREQTVVFAGNLDVFDADPAAEAKNFGQTDEEMLRLAQTMGLLRAQLAAWGYPQYIYEGAIADFEANGVATLSSGGQNPIYDGAAMEQLVGQINTARRTSAPSLPPVTYVMQANALYVRPVILRSAPAGGRVWVITQLRFDVCRLSVANPYDIGNCPQWREADPQNPMYLAGTYAFQVRWSDGRNAQGQRTIYNDRSEAPIVYVLP